MRAGATTTASARSRRRTPRSPSASPCSATSASASSTGGSTARRQLQVAAALERAVENDAIRLVITTGDNVYLGHQDTAGTGNEDDEWYSSFYEPYRYVLNRVPFFPTVGNHDAGDSESSDDRDQLIDNLFLDHRFGSKVEEGSASIGPGLFYRFQVGANVEFICIDTSIASGMDVEHYFDDPRHYRWIQDALDAEGAALAHPVLASPAVLRRARA